MQIAFPWQYSNYSPITHTLLWAWRFLALAQLSKLLPGLFSPLVYMMLQDPGLSYSTILERGLRIRRVVMRGLLAGLAAAVLLLVSGGMMG
jgi:hypothetical protein